jgi:hypothetical protein
MHSNNNHMSLNTLSLSSLIILAHILSNIIDIPVNTIITSPDSINQITDFTNLSNIITNIRLTLNVFIK